MRDDELINHLESIRRTQSASICLNLPLSIKAGKGHHPDRLAAHWVLGQQLPEDRCALSRTTYIEDQVYTLLTGINSHEHEKMKKFSVLLFSCLFYILDEHTRSVKTWATQVTTLRISCFTTHYITHYCYCHTRVTTSLTRLGAHKDTNGHKQLNGT